MELQIKSKREDVMYVADKELGKARERVSATTEAMLAKEEDLRQSWAAALAAGVPQGFLGAGIDASMWLSQLSEEVKSAKAAEAAARLGRADAGEEGGGSGQIVLLGKEVNEMLGAWDGRLAGVKDYLQGLLHCRHASEVERLLKGVVGALQWPQERRLQQVQRWGVQHRTQLQQQQQWGLEQQQDLQQGLQQQEQQGGEVEQRPQKQYLPQEVARACSQQFLDCPAERRVLWRFMFKGRACAGGWSYGVPVHHEGLPTSQQQQQQQQKSSGSQRAVGHQVCSSCKAVAAGGGGGGGSSAAGIGEGEETIAGVALSPSAAAALGAVLGEACLMMPSGSALYEQAHKLLARSVLRAVEKRHATFAAKVSAAAAAAAGGGGGGRHGLLGANHIQHHQGHMGEQGAVAHGASAVAAAVAATSATAAGELHVALQGLPLRALTAAWDAVHAAAKLLKLHGALHLDQLKEEVAMSDYEAAAAEAAAAAAGQLPAVAALVADKTASELRKQVRQFA